MSSALHTAPVVPTGLAARPEAVWGTHICHFYRTADDLASVLVPYFAAGLGNLERCIWVASEPLPAAAAKRALRRAVPDLEHLVEEGAIEIVDHDEWYLRESSLETEEVLALWSSRERQALRDGFNGLRITGNTTWLGADDWETFQAYERCVHEAFRSRRILALCSYSLDRYGAKEILEVGRRHGFALVPRNGGWVATDSVMELMTTVGDAREALRPLHERDAGIGSGHPEPIAGFDDLMPADPARLVAELELRARHAVESTRRRQEAEDAERLARRQLEAANQRLAQLQRVTAALSEAVTPDDIGQVAIAEIVSAVGAQRAVLVLPDGPDALRVAVHHGFPDQNQALFSRFAVDAPLPAAEAFRTGRAVFIGSAAELAERYPNLERLPASPSSASLPLDVGGSPLGVLGFGFESDHQFTPMECALLHDLARQVGCALDRARLYEAARSSEARLLEASRRKDEFLALLGHELRNPLAPIVTALEVMKLKLAAEASRWTELGVIERQVTHLGRLVDDLLDVSRITEGKLELRKTAVDLERVLRLAVELATPLIEQRGHQLVVESTGERLRVEADSSRLAQAIGNVLGNAAKYTAPGGRITLRSRRQGGDAVIEIADTGSGIAPEMLGSIFEPFVQVERTVESAQGGLGLGLALVKSVVELHGGSVRASSEGLGRGSEFRIRIPALPVPVTEADHGSLATAADAVTGAGSPPQQVLIVDDNRDAADSLAAMLRMLGHHTHVAYDGRGALEKARAAAIDVALLDIDLPDMSGYDVARRLRERAQRPSRFIAITGFGTDLDHERSRAEGFVEHLVKPIDHARLLHLLRG